MSLLADYQESFGGPRTVRFPDFATDYLTADLDLSGFSILGLSLDDLEFDAQLAHKIYCGPTIGSAAPTFRYMTAAEIDAQPSSPLLSDIAELESLSALGLNLLTLAPPAGTSYMLSSHLGIPSFLSSSQLLADVSQHINTNKNLSPGSDTLISSQRAVRDYVLSRTGGRLPIGITPAPVDSADSIDLDPLDENIKINGTTTITEFTLAEDEERFVVFDDALTIEASASILTASGDDITTQANATAVIRGVSPGIVEIYNYHAEDFKIHYGGDFSTAAAFLTGGTFAANGNFDMQGSFLGVTTNSTIIRPQASNAAIDVALPTQGAWYSGLGSPEGSKTANLGAIYTSLGGGASTTLYVKESGNGTNTGWVPK